VSRMRIDFPYLMQDRDRHGNVRVYVRRDGRKVRINAPMGSPGFAKAYSEAMDALEHPEGPQGRSGFRAASPGTLGWLAARYFGSRRFVKLDPKSQARVAWLSRSAFENRRSRVPGRRCPTVRSDM
jgi:hypothetical protein